MNIMLCFWDMLQIDGPILHTGPIIKYSMEIMSWHKDFWILIQPCTNLI